MDGRDELAPQLYIHYLPATTATKFEYADDIAQLART